MKKRFIFRDDGTTYTPVEVFNWVADQVASVRRKLWNGGDADGGRCAISVIGVNNLIIHVTRSDGVKAYVRVRTGRTLKLATGGIELGRFADAWHVIAMIVDGLGVKVTSISKLALEENGMLHDLAPTDTKATAHMAVANHWRYSAKCVGTQPSETRARMMTFTPLEVFNWAADVAQMLKAEIGLPGAAKIYSRRSWLGDSIRLEVTGQRPFSSIAQVMIEEGNERNLTRGRDFRFLATLLSLNEGLHMIAIVLHSLGIESISICSCSLERNDGVLNVPDGLRGPTANLARADHRRAPSTFAPLYRQGEA